MTVAVDIGASKIAVRTRAGREHDVVFPFHGSRTAREEIDHLLDGLDRAVGGRAGSGFPVVVASAPDLDEDGRVLAWPNHSGWAGLELVAELESALGSEVIAVPDGIAVAVADTVDTGLGDLVSIGVGTGLSIAVVAAGRAIRGARGLAAAFSHYPLTPGTAVCVCGRTGCAQATLCGPAVLRRARSAAGRDVEAAQFAGAVHARQGWACAALEPAVAELAALVELVQAAFDPAGIFISGGFAREVPELVARAGKRVASQARVELSRSNALDGAWLLASENEDAWSVVGGRR